MSTRSRLARGLVPLFVAATLALLPTPAAATHNVADGGYFLPCGSGSPGLDPNNCIVSFQVNGTAVAGGVEGPADSSGLDLSVFFTLDGANQVDMLQIQVENADLGSGQDRYELDALVSATDTVTIVLKVSQSDFTPFFMIGAGVITTWEWDDAANELTIVVKPGASTFSIPGTLAAPTNSFCPSDSYDEGGDCYTADVDYDAAILLAADNMPTSAGLTAQGVPVEFHQDIIDEAQAYTGGFISTDAQEFAIPGLDTSTDPPTVFFDLSAAHFMSDGVTENQGFFEVLLPEKIFVLWGMVFDQNSPPGIGAAADGSAISLQAPEWFPARGGFDAGWLVRSNTILYSSPTITLAPASSSAVVDEPTELDLSKPGTGPATTRLPVALPDTGEVTRDVTLNGTGASLVIAQGTTVTVGGVPFTGTINPPTRVQGRPGGLRGAVAISATGSAESQSVSALADEDIVFDPPVTITIVDTSDEAADSRIVRIAPDGSITDLAGTMTGRGVVAKITGLGTYGLATELDLAKIISAPSINVTLPVRLPADGVIDFPTSLLGTSGSVAFEPGTAVTDAAGAAFSGTLSAPASATALSGVGSVVDLSSSANGAKFSQPATLSVFAPAGVAAGDSALVSVSGTATTCLASTLAADSASRETALTTLSGIFGLALPIVAAPQAAIRDFPTQAGLHSRWAGQSAAQSLCAGQVAELAVRLRNTGTMPWTQGGANPVVLAARDAAGAALAVSPLYDTRLATHSEESVAPGEVGTFRFKVRAPATVGAHRLSVLPVAEGLQWLEDEGVYVELVTR